RSRARIIDRLERMGFFIASVFTRAILVLAILKRSLKSAEENARYSTRLTSDARPLLCASHFHLQESNARLDCSRSCNEIEANVISPRRRRSIGLSRTRSMMRSRL